MSAMSVFLLDRSTRFYALTLPAQLKEVMLSSDGSRSQSFCTLASLADHRYTHLSRPTPSVSVEDQSTRFK